MSYKRVAISRNSLKNEEMILESQYKETIDDLLRKFRESLPNQNELLVQSFKNYLQTQVKKMNYLDEDKIKTIITKTANAIIKSDYENKKDLLEDKNFEELYGISFYIFRLAKQSFLNEDILEDVDNGNINIRQIMQRARELKGMVKPHNQVESRILYTEAFNDCLVIGDPLSRVVSGRIRKLYQYKGDDYIAMFEDFYESFNREVKHSSKLRNLGTTDPKEFVKYKLGMYKEFKANYKAKRKNNKKVEKER